MIRTKRKSKLLGKVYQKSPPELSAIPLTTHSLQPVRLGRELPCLPALGLPVPTLILAFEEEPSLPSLPLLFFPPTLTESHTQSCLFWTEAAEGAGGQWPHIAVRSQGQGKGKRKWSFKELFRLFHNIFEEPALSHPCEFLNHLLRSPGIFFCASQYQLQLENQLSPIRSPLESIHFVLFHMDFPFSCLQVFYLYDSYTLPFLASLLTTAMV